MCLILQNIFYNLDPATFAIGSLWTKYTHFLVIIKKIYGMVYGIPGDRREEKANFAGYLAQGK
jgi:hypothetical protein